eukprot:TRINITY_DN6277_c0_g1_i1.p1 TRINITY_DN6277_c0_g1~~TRINITY_DN6277_c0_g1_i1.p1  ORF type:complete len:571 (+),score=100.63 TRINITY_DN6277_c0_g1_i1:166-1878(+)
MLRSLVGSEMCIRDSFASVWTQIQGLSGEHGIYPAALMLARIRTDLAAPERWFRFPAGHLWVHCSDRALTATCASGVASAAYAVWGGEHSSKALLGCWSIMVTLCTVNPLLQYPWDCLLMEALLVCGCFVPDLLPIHHGGIAISRPPSLTAVYLFRLMLLRLMLGMAKFKFSAGWSHGSNLLFLKWFLCWQPLPTPLAYQLFHALPAQLFELLYRCMYCVEVLVPAWFIFAPHPSLRVAAAALTILLQLAIALQGNYGIFNLLTSALAIPLLSTGTFPTDTTALQGLMAGLLFLHAVISFPHNSYTTNAWPFCVPESALTSFSPGLQRVARTTLAIARWFAPYHVAHGYGVFTPGAPNHVTYERRQLVLRYSVDGGNTYHPIKPRWYPSESADRLRWFAPHQPRLDHHLFYEGFEVPLSETSHINPYFTCSPSIMPRVITRLMEPSAAVWGLFDSPPPTQPITQIAVVRHWVRFATPAESKDNKAVWVQLDPSERGFPTVELYQRGSTAVQSPVNLVPLSQQEHAGFWGQYAGAWADCHDLTVMTKCVVRPLSAAEEVELGTRVCGPGTW